MSERPSGTKPIAHFAMRPESLARHLFADRHLRHLDALVHLDPTLVLTEFTSPTSRAALGDAEILLTGWGCPRITTDVLESAPRLRAVIHSGGGIAGLVETGAGFSARGIEASNAGEANAIPVAQYTVAMILLANKSAFRAAHLYRERRSSIDREVELLDSGNYEATVGIVGASRIGRAVIDLLRPFALDTIVTSPSMTPEKATQLGVRMGTLDDVMRQSNVVSLHQPVTPTTRGSIDKSALALLRDGATLINTARGEVVDQAALLDELRSGRLNAILDVTTPEPLHPDDELWDLPNVVVTPHIAGAMGRELHRLGDHVVAEVQRYFAGEGFKYPELVDD